MASGVAESASSPSVPMVRADWFIVCAEQELGDAPLKAMVWDTPLVVFRTSAGDVAVFEDRCPHRNVPLSKGVIEQDGLRCAYHGWCFGTDGQVTEVPGLDPSDRMPAVGATAWPSRLAQGFVWVWADPQQVPVGEPFHFKVADQPGYLTVRKRLPVKASLHAVLENALDVPHTSFLHRGLFRGGAVERQPLTCRVRRWDDRVEAEFIGEARPEGLAARWLAPSGAELEHWDRFVLPAATEVEYRMGVDAHVVLSSMCTPVSAHETIMFAVVSIKARLPNWLLKMAITPIAMRIFEQDAVILELQTDTEARFGGARHASTAADLLGGHILGLLRRHARGERGEADGPLRSEREVTLHVG